MGRIFLRHKTDMTANAVIANHESQMVSRLRRETICRRYSKSGLPPYFLIPSCPSDADISVRASAPRYIGAIRAFTQKNARRGISPQQAFFPIPWDQWINIFANGSPTTKTRTSSMATNIRSYL